MRSAPRLSGRTFSARGPPCPSPRSPPGALPRFQKGRPRGDRAGAPGPAHPRQGLRAHGPRVRRPRLRPARALGAAARVQARSRGCGQGSSSAQARTPTGARTHARAGAPRGVFPAPARARGSAALPAGLVARALRSRRTWQRTAAWAGCPYADCGSRFATQVQHVPRWSEASTVRPQLLAHLFETYWSLRTLPCLFSPEGWSCNSGERRPNPNRGHTCCRERPLHKNVLNFFFFFKQ